MYGQAVCCKMSSTTLSTRLSLIWNCTVRVRRYRRPRKVVSPNWFSAWENQVSPKFPNFTTTVKYHQNWLFQVSCSEIKRFTAKNAFDTNISFFVYMYPHTVDNLILATYTQTLIQFLSHFREVYGQAVWCKTSSTTLSTRLSLIWNCTVRVRRYRRPRKVVSPKWFSAWEN